MKIFNDDIEDILFDFWRLILLGTGCYLSIKNFIIIFSEESVEESLFNNFWYAGACIVWFILAVIWLSKSSEYFGFNGIFNLLIILMITPVYLGSFLFMFWLFGKLMQFLF